MNTGRHCLKRETALTQEPNKQKILNILNTKQNNQNYLQVLIYKFKIKIRNEMDL